MNLDDPIVFLIDDDKGALDSMVYLIESYGFQVKCYSSAQEFLGSFDPSQAGCILVDFRMPGMTGLELHNELKKRQSVLPVIIMSAYGTVPTVAQAFRDGVVDFLQKPTNDAVLVPRLREAFTLNTQLRQEQKVRSERLAKLQSLTAREREVLDSIVQGKAMKEIASEFNTSFQTIAKHRSRVLEKLGLESDVELTRMMLELNLITSAP